MSHEYELQLAHERLANLLRIMLTRWGDVKERWNDPVSQRFEQEHIVELERTTRLYLRELEEAIRLFAQGARILDE